MIVLDNAILSDDLVEQQFVCDLAKCKGACCVEGDLGAPLTEEEREQLEKLAHKIKPYLSEEGKKTLAKEGLYVFDQEGDFSTPVLAGGKCAYVVTDDKGHLECGIERAYEAGDSDFKKPISCHLYPVRITKYDQYDALNYDRWDICAAACVLGEKLQMPVYKFIKPALIRRYGEDWYQRLELEIEKQAVS